MGLLPALLKTPSYPDPDQQRVSALVTQVTIPAFALVFLGLVSFIAVSQRPVVSVAFHGPALLGLIGVQWLNHTGRVQQARNALVWLFWGIFTVACTFFDGVSSASMGGFMVVIAAAALLSGPQSAIVVAVASSLVAAALVVAELEGVLPEPILVISPAFKMVSWAMYFGMLGVLVHLAVRSLHLSLAESEDQRRALASSVSVDLLRSVAGSVADAVLVADARSVVRAVNPEAVALFGRSEEEMLGVPLTQLVPVTTFDVAPGERSEGEQRFETDAGRMLEVRYALSAVRTGTGTSLVWMGRDISERRRTELAQREARQAAELASRAKSDFLANMSHELRTPLNAILGYTEMLIDDASDAGTSADLGRIHHAGTGLLSLINDILDLSKIEAGKLDVQLAPVEVFGLVDEVFETISPLVTQKGNRIDIERRGESPLVQADSGRLRQVLINLLSNANKFTEGGWLRIAVRTQAGATCIDVVDTGIGMAPEQLEVVFDAFTQAESGKGSKFGGTGLGLTISRQLCELMGGSLSARSELGTGSTFTVVLPTA